LKKLTALSLSSILSLLVSFISSRLRFIIGYLILFGVAIGLGFAAIWFVFLSNPVDSLLHNKTNMPATMFMVGKVTLLNNDGTPAAGAVAVLNKEQQAQADAQGVVYFEHLMFHDHTLDITYRGEHYALPLHIHTQDNFVTLGMSIEFRDNLGYLFIALLLGWLVFGACVINKLQAGLQRRLSMAMVTFRSRLRRATLRYRFATASFLVLIVMLTSLGLVVLDPAASPVQAAGETLATLPVPDKLAVEEDDNNAVLSWGDPIKPDRPNPANVTGYRISWGLAGSSAAPTVQLTSERIIQLQPLTNGQTYQAQVQSVDGSGNISAPSQTVTFTGTPARVNALRSRMTGFFDDFNQVAGPFDELKWNQAFSACNDPAMSASFINSQFHAHNMELSGHCDRAQVVNRPRATFDFTGRTGTVAFDLDGLTSRSMWYLDLIDTADGVTDITSHISESGSGVGNPGKVLRIRQNENSLSFQYVDASGVLKTIADTNWKPYPPLDWAGFKTVPNMRRHWELHISQQQIEVTINGKVVLATAFNLPFSQATVHWTAFSYNTSKHNVPYALVHWDNFGFDGPAAPLETHNYRAAGYAGRDLIEAVRNVPVATSINIPDKVSGALAQRLMFTLQMKDFSAYQWSASDKVVVNGRAIAVPKPVLTGDGININVPYSVRLELPAGTLITGQNQLSFVMAYSHVLNIHLEVDFAKGSAPAYTQPAAIYPAQSSMIMPTMTEVGPSVTIATLGNTPATDYGRYTTKVFPVSGTVNVKAKVNHELAMDAMGKNPGISRVQIRLNKSPIYELDLGTPGAPATNIAYNLDTTRFADGNYQLDVVAFNPGGAVSIPNYFEAHAAAGDYYPIYLNISNSGNTVPATTPTTALPTRTPLPTTVAPTATAAPTVAVPTAAPKPSSTPGSMVAWVMSSKVLAAPDSNTASQIISRFTAPPAAKGSYIMDVEVYDLATNARVGHWYPVKTVSPGQIITLTNSIKLNRGTYIIKQGVFTTTWSFIAWQDGPRFTIK
jgi:hypothetical protein